MSMKARLLLFLAVILVSSIGFAALPTTSAYAQTRCSLTTRTWTVTDPSWMAYTTYTRTFDSWYFRYSTVNGATYRTLVYRYKVTWERVVSTWPLGPAHQSKSTGFYYEDEACVTERIW